MFVRRRKSDGRTESTSILFRMEQAMLGPTAICVKVSHLRLNWSVAKHISSRIHAMRKSCSDNCSGSMPCERCSTGSMNCSTNCISTNC